MTDYLTRGFTDLLARTQGPMWFRLIVQPLVAIVLGVRAGLKNAREASRAGQQPDSAYRSRMFRQGLRDVGIAALIGGVLDIVFQWIVLRAVYPIEMLIVVLLIVIVPYQITRTVVARIAREGSVKK